MRKEEAILKTLTTTGDGLTKSIRKNGDEISVCQIKIHAQKSPWRGSSTEEIWTYKAGMLQTYELRTAKEAGNFIPSCKITHHYKPADDKDYDIEETITTEVSQEPTRVETRFRGTGSVKSVTVNGTTYSRTFLGNEEELLHVTEDDFDKDCYDHVVFTTSVDDGEVTNNVRVSTPAGVGEYKKSQMLIGPSTFGVTNIKDSDESCQWKVRHPIYPELPSAMFYRNNVMIFDYEWRNTKYGAARFTRVRSFTNDMDTIVKYTAVADALNGEYEPPEGVYCPQTFPRIPNNEETVDVIISEGEYAGSDFVFHIRPISKNDTDTPLFYGGIKPEDNKNNTDGFLVIPYCQSIKLTMNGYTPNSKRTIGLMSLNTVPPNNAFIVRITENVNDAITNFISNYEMDTTYIRATETYKYVQEDGTIIIQETEYATPNTEEHADAAVSSV